MSLIVAGIGVNPIRSNFFLDLRQIIPYDVMLSILLFFIREMKTLYCAEFFFK